MAVHRFSRMLLLLTTLLAILITIKWLLNDRMASQIDEWQWNRIGNRCVTSLLVKEHKDLVVQLNEVQSESRCLHSIAQNYHGNLIVEFNSITQFCRAFNYKHVCHSLNLHSTAATSSNCSVFARIIGVSNVSSLRGMASLKALWIFGDELNYANENLVCGQSNTYSWQLNNIDLSYEGATFNKFRSAMRLKAPKLSRDLITEFTWLLRLKRLPGMQPFLQNYHCKTGAVAAHLWEAGGDQNLYFYTGNHYRINHRIYTKSNPLPASSNSYVDIGVTVVANQAASYKLYIRSQFVPQTEIESYDVHDSSLFGQIDREFHCFSIGDYKASSDPRKFVGTIRSVAMFNASLSSMEIANYFNSIL